VPLLRPTTTKDLLDHVSAFEAMKPAAGRSMLARFADLYARACSPAYFAAFFGIREHLLRSQVDYTFQELLSIAIVQRQLLPISPPSWAGDQVESLIDEEYWKTNNWIKRVCDVQRRDRDNVETDEEFVFWRKWRAPLLLVMEPSRYAPFEAERMWERQDEDTTIRWLDLFTGDVVRGLEKVLKDAVGQAHLVEMKRQPVATPPPTTASAIDYPPITSQSLPHEDKTVFSHTDDYRSIRFKGETHLLTRSQASMVRLLNIAYQSGYPEVTKDKLLSAVEAETSEVRSFFKGSPLWGTLVVKASRKGIYHLNLPHPAVP
jgi:hypothetical protein